MTTDIQVGTVFAQPDIDDQTSLSVCIETGFEGYRIAECIKQDDGSKKWLAYWCPEMELRGRAISVIESYKESMLERARQQIP